MGKANNKPTAGWLEFIKSEADEGFVSDEVSSNDINPSIIVRELIQNSLDAGLQTGKNKTEVVFQFDYADPDEIPGIKKYKEIFQMTQEQRSVGIPERAVIRQISAILEPPRKPIPVLHILDNGMGFDQEGIRSILANGSSSKRDRSSGNVGSFGLGHFTAFLASGMHYILYGGVTAGGKRIMSAHAILASHTDDGNEDRGKDGYYITGRKKKKAKGGSRYDYPLDSNIPRYMQKLLNRVASEYDSGSAVSIIAFNNFQDESGDEGAAQSIIDAAAKHFFPAIHQGHLEVQVKHGKNIHSVNRETLHNILEGMREQTYTIKNDLISGSKAYAAYRTLIEGECNNIPTSFGNVGLHFRPAGPGESTRINLFRSGMYICAKIPMNDYATYRSRKKFNALLLVNPPQNKNGKNKAFELIHSAEEARHTSINKERLQEEERRDFNKLFKEIQSAIKELAPEDAGDEFSPDDEYMILDSDSLEDFNPGRDKRKSRNKPPQISLPYSEIPEYLDDYSDPDGALDIKKPGSGRSKRGPKPNPISPTPSFRNSGKRKRFKAAVRRHGNKLHLALSPVEDINGARLRIILDRGSDPSCLEPLPNRLIAIKSDAIFAGEEVSEDKFEKKEDGRICGIILGSLTTRRYEAEVTFDEDIPRVAVTKVDLISDQDK